MMVYCPRCGYFGSVLKSSKNNKCPECDSKLNDTDITKSEWDGLSSIERNKRKSAFKPSSADIELGNRLTMVKLAKDMNTVKKWTVFFGVLSVIGICLGFILGLIYIIMLMR